MHVEDSETLAIYVFNEKVKSDALSDDLLFFTLYFTLHYILPYTRLASECNTAFYILTLDFMPFFNR